VRAAYAKVIVDVPIDQPLDYRLDDAVSCDDPIGLLCVVPVGSRLQTGVVVDVVENSAVPPAKIRAVRSLMSTLRPLDRRWLDLTKFAASYYQHAWGEVAIPALPPFLRTPPGPRFGQSLERIRRVEARAAIASSAATTRRSDELNVTQKRAVQRIDAARGFAPHLLFGVTGSGKTNVYLEIIAHRLASDGRAQALLLVPEINLTPQLEARLRERFPDQLVVAMHSGLNTADRNAAWMAAHEGRARVVLGTRLAVFASMPHVAAIIVDEEHDPSYKAGDGVRYSARDLAIKRAQIERIPVVLGSATPSLESWAQMEAGRYVRLDLPDPAHVQDRADTRLRPATRPSIETVDTQLHRPVNGLSEPTRAALEQTLARSEQSLVFINRRGYAPVITCESCGWLSDCPRCSAFSAFHKIDATLRCHHCGWQRKVPAACPTCGNTDLRAVGQGTQRIEESLAAALPGARIVRIDRDSTRRRGTASASLDAVHAGEVDVLVGTQMIVKGHDFRRVTLVVVLNADSQLVAPDFRAPERLFATLVQVAGRAGRSGLPSQVLIQSRFSSHPLFSALARFDYAYFARQQLADRRRSAVPPYSYQALLTVESKVLPAALSFLERAAAAFEFPNARCFDPVPMPLARRAGVYRAQLLVESDARLDLHASLVPWLNRIRDLTHGIRPRVKWQIELDPVTV